LLKEVIGNTNTTIIPMSQNAPDPIMKSINKSLQMPVKSGSVIANTNAIMTDDISVISDFSNISNVSNLSQSIYTIRQDRRLELFDFLKEKTSIYRKEFIYHGIISGTVFIIAMIIGVDIFYMWSAIASMFFSIIYAVFIGIHLQTTLQLWRHNRFEGINRFWTSCLSLAYKNAVLLQEYIDVYEYRLQKSKNSNNVDSYGTYLIDEDIDYQSLPPAELKNVLQRIHSYIRLSYELSNLKQSDNLSIQRGVVYCNVSNESITNERNRKIEKYINNLDTQKRADVVDGWNTIDKRESHQSVAIVPYRWMIYEYRNLFRYLNSSKYLREIYDNLGKDFMSYQNTVDDISRSFLNICLEEEDYMPVDIQDTSIRMTEIMGVCADIFFAINIVYYVFAASSWIGMIVNLILGILLGGFIHLILICVIYNIRDLLITKRNVNLKKKMDIIMKEMKIICC
jgi:hypothetical protein